MCIDTMDGPWRLPREPQQSTSILRDLINAPSFSRSARIFCTRRDPPDREGRYLFACAIRQVRLVSTGWNILDDHARIGIFAMNKKYLEMCNKDLPRDISFALEFNWQIESESR